MKISMLCIAIIFSFIYKNYTDKIMALEKEVYDLYSNNFIDYIYLDENYKLKIDKTNLKYFFEKKGYKIVFYDDLNFKISFKYILYFEKEYCFYLEINDEF